MWCTICKESHRDCDIQDEERQFIDEQYDAEMFYSDDGSYND